LLVFMCWIYSLCCTYACHALVVDTLNSALMLVLWRRHLGNTLVICELLWSMLWLMPIYVLWCLYMWCDLLMCCDLWCVYMCCDYKAKNKKKYWFLRLCRVPWYLHSAKASAQVPRFPRFAECKYHGTQQRQTFAECHKTGTQQRGFFLKKEKTSPSVVTCHSANKRTLPSVKRWAHGKLHFFKKIQCIPSV
jgi:hypothetical protein